MKGYLKYAAVTVMSVCTATGSFTVMGQTSTGRITVKMAHGPIVMEIGRSKVQRNDNEIKQPKKTESIYQVEAPVPPRNDSGVTYDSNDKVLSFGPYTYKFVKVNNCRFNMGATEEQAGEAETTESRHRVELFGYYLGSTEVPQWLWKAVMNNNPSINVGDENPVENVSWEECAQFAERLSGLIGRNMGLPTETQMELAMREGKITNDNKYGTTQPLGDVAWYAENSDGHTHKVGQKKPNALGLYDITGNVGEWCADWYGLYPDVEEKEPTGPDNGVKKVYRSASYKSPASDCRTSKRFAETPDYKSPDVGLRLVLK